MRKSIIAAAVAALAFAACTQPAPSSSVPSNTSPPADAGPVKPVSSTVPPGSYVLEKTHTSVVARIDHMGLSKYTFRFTGFDGTLQLDPKNPAASRIEFTVNPSSIETDYPGEKNFDQELAQDEKFFNAAKFAEAKFVSTGVTITGERSAKVDGDMTLLGITKPASFEVTFNGDMEAHPFAKVPAIGFSARGTIDRRDWGMTYLSGQGVGDTVEIQIEAEFLQKPPV
jgi:polyisoprenoid-binding protein YceI